MGVDETGRATRRAVLAGALVGGLATGCTHDDGGGTGGRGGRDLETRLVSGRLRSRYAAGGTTAYRLAVPTGTVSGLVIALPGRGADERSMTVLRLPELAARHSLAVASVGGDAGYWHPRRDGSDLGRVVADALVPLALERAGLPGRTRIALLGWSMGGFGALWLGRHLGRSRVRAVAAESAAVWLHPGDTPAGAFDDAADFTAHDPIRHAEGLRGIPVRLDCGTSDPFVRSNRALAQRLRTAKVAVTATFDAGGHSNDYWGRKAPAQLRWIASTRP